MNERTALCLVYGISAVVVTVWMLGLPAIGAPRDVIVLGPMFVLIIGASAVARITMHYGRPGHRRDDE